MTVSRAYIYNTYHTPQSLDDHKDLCHAMIICDANNSLKQHLQFTHTAGDICHFNNIVEDSS